MQWTRAARLTGDAAGGRRSRVVLTPRRWRQVGRKRFRRRWWQTSPVTRESAEQAVKTIAQGMPDVSGEPVVTNARAFYPPRAAAGATGARHSPLPSWGSVCSPPGEALCPFVVSRAEVSAQPGHIVSREGEDACSPSLRAKRRFHEAAGKKSGLLGFARNDEQKSIGLVAV